MNKKKKLLTHLKPKIMKKFKNKLEIMIFRNDDWNMVEPAYTFHSWKTFAEWSKKHDRDEYDIITIEDEVIKRKKVSAVQHTMHA
jgi:hypothetical protein